MNKKEVYMYEKRPTYMKKDQQKRPTDTERGYFVASER